MVLRPVNWLAAILVLADGAPTHAEPPAFPISIRSEALALSLSDLARQTGIELAYDRSLLGDSRSPAIRGHLPIDLALQRLLSGTDLSVRRATSGAWIIERRRQISEPLPFDLAAPEILVVGSQSQDVDIRRRENDIQPYQIATGAEIIESHRDNLDQFFQSRVTANTATAAPSFSQGGDTSSLIDLRGLGSAATLILVDGIRQPGVPTDTVGFSQPDINAIPLHAIERIETLTGTAGGVYGLGALGGVVNVVLRHDYHDLEVHATTGINTRGDARRLELEGGLGFSPDHGNTNISLYVSHSWQRPLLQGQNDLTERGYRDHYAFAPEDYGGGGNGDGTLSVASESGENLVLKSEYGGASLGSDRSFAPQGFTGTRAALASLFLRHAGQVDLSLPQEQQASNLDSTPITTSALLDVRHRFGGAIETYFDALILRNQGRYENFEPGDEVTLAAESPFNPFQNAITVDFEGPAGTHKEKSKYFSNRFTLGLIAPLSLTWKLNGEATFGSAEYSMHYTATHLDYSEIVAEECPDLNPFLRPDTFRASLDPCSLSYYESQIAKNQYSEQSVRAAGPVFRTDAGLATLSISLQNRREHVPANVENKLYDGVHYYDDNSDPFTEGGESSLTRSIYSELEAPLIRREAGLPLIDGLSIQFAVRHDWQGISYHAEAGKEHSNFSATMYTIGAKTYPARWVMLRASYATGQQPPPSQNFSQGYYESYIADLIDPKRGGVQPPNYDQYLEITGALKPRNVVARTLALGMVLNPEGGSFPRVSVDYSHTRESGVYADPDLNLILAREDMWPQRVTRAPLSDEDRADGYTGGAIEIIDARGLSAATIIVKSIDARLDWRVPLAGGVLHAYGSVTRQLLDRQRGAAIDTAQFVGFADGPLKWRGNGGAEWTKDRTTVSFNLQYFGRYRIVDAEYLAFASIVEEPQGSKYVKAQAYLDLSMSRRFHSFWAGSDHEMTLDLGIVNLLNHAPPYQANYPGSQFSPYGDPRLRRVELSLNASF